MKRSAIIILLASVLLVFILLVSGYVVRKRQKDIIENAQKEETLRTIHAAQLISDFIEERLKILDVVSAWMNPFWCVSPKAFEEDIEENVSRLLRQYPGFDSIYFLNRENVIVWSIPESKSMNGVSFSRDVRDGTEYQKLFKQARDQGSAKVAPLLVTSFSPKTGKLVKTVVLLVMAPVLRGGSYLGMLLAILRADAIGRRFFPVVGSDKRDYWVLLDDKGTLLYANAHLPTSLQDKICRLAYGYSRGHLTKACVVNKIISYRDRSGREKRFLLSCFPVSVASLRDWHVVRIRSLSFIETAMRDWLIQTRVIAIVAIIIMVFAAVFIIISLQKSEEKLDLLNRKYRDLLDSLYAGAFSFDKTGKIDYVNRRACEILGYSPEELIGKDRLFFAWQKEKEEIRKISQLRLEGKRGAETYRAHMVHRSGKVIDVEIYASPILDVDGNIQGVRVMFMDITQQIEMERELQNYTKHLEELVEQRTRAFQESEALYRSIFETSLAIIYIQQDDKFRIMNKAGMAFFGFESEEEMLRASVWDTVPEGERERRKKNAERRVQGEDVPSQYESLVINKDGEIRVVTCNFQRIHYQNEQAILAILLDVTDRKRLEAEVTQAEKLKSMGQLATGVAHDFNNILSAILGRIELLERDPEDPEKVLSYAAKIRHAIDQGINTIKRIQDFTRVRQDRLTSQLLPLHEILEDAIEITRYAWKDQAQKQGITIQVEKELKDENLPLASELREAFMNIILNAVDAMREGGKLLIRTESIKMEDGKRGVRVIFEDTGKGIPPDVIKHIFKPFFSTKGSEGSGMGLTIVQGVVERLGGRVEIVSEVGKGTKVLIELPWQVSSPSEDQHGRGEISSRVERGKGGAILVVDDEPALPEIFKELLIPQGFEVVTATSGEEALHLFLEDLQRFALVFTDLGMPGMNGWELVRRIREVEKEIPIVLMTGWGLEISEEEVRKSGVTEMLSKPVTLNKINEIVARFLGTSTKER